MHIKLLHHTKHDIARKKCNTTHCNRPNKRGKSIVKQKEIEFVATNSYGDRHDNADNVDILAHKDADFAIFA